MMKCLQIITNYESLTRSKICLTGLLQTNVSHDVLISKILVLLRKLKHFYDIFLYETLSPRPDKEVGKRHFFRKLSVHIQFSDWSCSKRVREHFVNR
jgi:hypothetical protein